MIEDILEKLYQKELMGKSLLVSVKDLKTNEIKLWKVSKEQYDKIVSQVRKSEFRL